MIVIPLFPFTKLFIPCCLSPPRCIFSRLKLHDAQCMMSDDNFMLLWKTKNWSTVDELSVLSLLVRGAKYT